MIDAKWFFTINPERNPAKYLRIFLDSHKTLLEFKPNIAISTGAGMTIPILLLAKTNGIKTVFIESAAQVDNPSLSGKIAYRFVDEFYYQWKALKQHYPRGTYIEPPFELHPAKKKKKLVLVVVGTHPSPFNRLIKMVDEVAKDFPDHEFVYIIGHSTYIPKLGRWCRFPDREHLRKLYKDARWVVAHAGVGTIMDSLENGVIPFVVPRLKRYGEHTNDHQLEIVNTLAERGLVKTGDKEALIKYLSE